MKKNKIFKTIAKIHLITLLLTCSTLLNAQSGSKECTKELDKYNSFDGGIPPIKSVLDNYMNCLKAMETQYKTSMTNINDLKSDSISIAKKIKELQSDPDSPKSGTDSVAAYKDKQATNSAALANQRKEIKQYATILSESYNALYQYYEAKDADEEANKYKKKEQEMKAILKGK